MNPKRLESQPEFNRKTYAVPVLHVYGDLAGITSTLGKSANASDGQTGKGATNTH